MGGLAIGILIAGTFTKCVARPMNDERKAVKSTAFDL